MYFICGKCRKSILEVYLKYTEVLQGKTKDRVWSWTFYNIYCFFCVCLCLFIDLYRASKPFPFKVVL